MKTSTKKLLITALILLIAGILIFFGAMCALGFDFGRLDTSRSEEKIHTINETFDKIVIDSDTARIFFKKAEDDNCKITCYEAENVSYAVSVEDNTLRISVDRVGSWYNFFNFSAGKTKITVFLPENEYNSLDIESTTGDVDIPADFVFDSLTIRGETADINCLASVSGELKIGVRTGKISLSSIKAKKAILSTSTGNIEVIDSDINTEFEIRTSTGRIRLTDIRCNVFSSTGTTGNVKLTNVIAVDSLEIERTTGDIVFEGCDAGSITVKTGTGNVTGTLLSDKIFLIDTSTGHVKVPKTLTGGKCEITSDTGDIDLSIE